MPDFVTVAKVSDLPPGQSACYPVGDFIVAVFNQEGTFYAINDLCPHMGASLSAGYVENGTVMCPWHAWRFRISDGTWCDNPRIKTQAFDVRVVGEEIQVLVPEKPARRSATES